MSSTKFQPNPGKRPHSEVEPEWPSLPGLSLVDAQQFAIKSQGALRSVQQSLSVGFSQTSALFLPLITPHQLQQRFRVKERSVFVVIRKSYSDLKSIVDSFDIEGYCGLYVRGPVGIGKSYLLYLLAAEYRLNRKKRVTYINDCDGWRVDKVAYILREFVTTFYDDTIEGKSIVEWCQDVQRSDRVRDMMKAMMEALVKYVKAKNLEWIVICDQHNALFNPPVVKKFPFNLIKYLSQNRGSFIKVIISASANNEGYPTEMKGWHTHEISSHRFHDNEFKVWCDHYQLETIGKVDSESDAAMDALFWTGGVPYELHLLWKQPGTLIEKTILYRDMRVKEMADSHAKFCDTLSDEAKRNLKVCVSRMALCISPPEIISGMDRQLFDILTSWDNGTMCNTITALNPVARRALIAYHDQHLLTPLSLVAEIVFAGTYTNDTKGRIIEQYIMTMLELSNGFSFKSRKTTKTGQLKKHVLNLVEIKGIIHFSGNKLPLQSYCDLKVTTLFVPKSPNYPGLDFFIWNSVRRVLMAFQVTIAKDPFNTHSKFQKGSDLYRLWQEFCFGMDKSKWKPIEVYWIIPKPCVENPKNFDDHLVHLEDLWVDFPALQKLTVQ